MKAKVEFAAVLAVFVVCVGVTFAKPHTHHPRKKVLVSTPTPTAAPSPTPTPQPSSTPTKIHTPDDIAALRALGAAARRFSQEGWRGEWSREKVAQPLPGSPC